MLGWIRSSSCSATRRCCAGAAPWTAGSADSSSCASSSPDVPSAAPSQRGSGPWQTWKGRQVRRFSNCLFSLICPRGWVKPARQVANAVRTWTWLWGRCPRRCPSSGWPCSCSVGCRCSTWAPPGRAAARGPPPSSARPRTAAAPSRSPPAPAPSPPAPACTCRTRCPPRPVQCFKLTAVWWVQDISSAAIVS